MSTKNRIPESAAFDLILSKVITGNEVLHNPVCHFKYQWNFETNTGFAKLGSIDGVNVDITLHPLGIEEYLDFMSDMSPTKFSLNGRDIVISRVMLDINKTTGERIGAIMFNEDGSTLQANEELTAGKLTLLQS